MCATTPKWKWAGAYKPMIDSYDDRFRTPEVHKRSVLRAMLTSGEPIDDNELLELLGGAMNEVWSNVESIVNGGGVTRLGMAHSALDENGNPTLGSNPFETWGWTPTQEA